MKNIINEEKRKEILVSDLLGNEIVAYKCKSTSSIKSQNYAVLARLHGVFPSPNCSSYGFIPLGESDKKPRYMANSWRECVKLASESRDLKIFDNFQEMVEAMSKKLF